MYNQLKWTKHTHQIITVRLILIGRGGFIEEIGQSWVVGTITSWWTGIMIIIRV